MSQAQENPNIFRMSQPAPIVWVNLFKPVAFDPKQAPRYKVAFLLDADHRDLPRLKKHLATIAKGKFGTVEGVKYPIEAGDAVAAKGAAKGKKYDFCAGKVVLSTHSVASDDRYPPRLVLYKGPDKDPQAFLDESRPMAQPYFYSGVQCVGLLNFGTYDPPLGPGVHCYINRIMSFNFGDKIASGTDDATAFGGMEQFKGYVGAVTPHDPTAGMDDEIPF